MSRLPVFAVMVSAMLAAAALTTASAAREPAKPAAAALPQGADPAEHDPQATRVLDRRAATRLLGATGITLQWIDWDSRGPVSITDAGGIFRITGHQQAKDGPGRLDVDGVVTEIGRDYFILDGTVTITDTPDIGRNCSANKQWRFAVTQNRRYWRLREFEWCDGLTDYVDIYF